MIATKTALKASDLRVGNWVNYQGKPIIIKEIYCHDEALTELPGYCINHTTIDAYNPILLTDEILYHTGFDLFYNNPRLECFYVNTSSYYPFNIVESSDHRFYYNDNLEIKYLHQLQNLYHALTGQELEINLL
jgi:hypothetical protein